MTTYPPGGVPEFVSSTELLAAQLNKLVDAYNATNGVGTGKFLWGVSGTSTENLINGIWLECNGVAISRTTYPDLFTYFNGQGLWPGSGDGSTTFNLPDARNREVLHHTPSGPTGAKTMGDKDSNAIGSRTPKLPTSTGNESSHTHGAGSYVIATGTVGSGSTGTTPNGGTPISGTSGAGSSHSHTVGATNGYLVGGIWVVKAFA